MKRAVRGPSNQIHPSSLILLFMTYQVLARKWRPQTFEEVTGQEHITHTLRNAVEHDRLHHAYIFSGARGVGKTSTARLFAKALNCHKSNKPTPAFCRTDDENICHSCREIAEGRSIDVQEIDAASTTGVQNVRDSIIDTIAISPARDRFKVFIIDEVHMLSTQAFNALLKTLEEPPPRVVFIMATTEGHRLLETIVSRCQQFEFRTIATAKIAERLRFVATAEKLNITDEALREIARAGEGSMRDAQSALDQIISFAGSEIKTTDVEAALGIAGVEMLARVMNALADTNSPAALAVVNDLVTRGHDLRNFCRDLMAYLRDMLVVKASDDADDVLELSDSERKELAEQSAAFSESDLVRYFHSLTETESALRDAPHPRYHLEIGLVKLIEMRRLIPLNQIVDRLSAIEESLRTVVPPAPGSAQSGSQSSYNSTQGSKSSEPLNVGSKKKSLPATESQQTDSFALSDTDFKSLDGLLTSSSHSAAKAKGVVSPLEASSVAPTKAERVTTDEPVMAGSTIENIKSELEKRRRMFLVTTLDAARRVEIEDKELVVEFTPDAKHLRDNLATSANVKILREICRDLVGHEISVRICIWESENDEDNGPVSREDEERLDKQRIRTIAEQNPAVQQVLKTFHGEIVDVRRGDDRSKAASQKPE
jgi:DNA polymerase III subunit gamma/tau